MKKIVFLHFFRTQPVPKAWLFGSYARGEQTPQSDVDILFVPDKSQHFSLFTLGGMYEDLKDLLGCEVDLITSNFQCSIRYYPKKSQTVNLTQPSDLKPQPSKGLSTKTGCRMP